MHTNNTFKNMMVNITENECTKNIYINKKRSAYSKINS